MDQGAALRTPRLLTGGVVVTLTAMLAVAPESLGAERVVLGEYFTWLNCVYCPPAGQQISGMVNLYGVNGTDPVRPGKLAVVEYNVWDGYQLPWGYNRSHVFYDPIFGGTPTFILDGLTDAYPPVSSFVSKFISRQVIPTPVTVSITVDESSPNVYDTTVTVCLEYDADPVDLRMYTILVEDWYPPTPSYSRNGFRQAAATTDVGLLADECTEVVSQFAYIPYTQHSNIKVIAWAQEPNYVWPADVYQAAIAVWPFEPPPEPCPWDCGGQDGEVGINDFLMLLADWGGASPCDFDGGGVGITDFLAMLANWGPCP